MIPIKKILVPTDFSDLSLEAMDVARSLAMVYDARIYLLHAVDIVTVVAFPTVDFTYEQALNEEAAKAQAMLEKLVEEHFKGDEDVSIVVRRGLQYDEIMQFAEEENVNLIVMATHGRTGLAHVLIGSVAEKVVRHSSVPVLTVKPHAMRTAKRTEREAHEIG